MPVRIERPTKATAPTGASTRDSSTAPTRAARASGCSTSATRWPSGRAAKAPGRTPLPPRRLIPRTAQPLRGLPRAVVLGVVRLVGLDQRRGFRSAARRETAQSGLSHLAGAEVAWRSRLEAWGRRRSLTCRQCTRSSPSFASSSSTTSDIASGVPTSNPDANRWQHVDADADPLAAAAHVDQIGELVEVAPERWVPAVFSSSSGHDSDSSSTCGSPSPHDSSPSRRGLASATRRGPRPHPRRSRRRPSARGRGRHRLVAHLAVVPGEV